jgi:hypothetical protein
MNKFAFIALALATASCATPESARNHVPPMACPSAPAAQAPQLLWSAGGFSAPESVVFDPATKHFYVSNVVGNPTERDGRGWISKLSPKGKLTAAVWADGRKGLGKDTSKPLNAPKGLRLRNGQLWVADIDEVASFQIATGKKSTSVTIPGAQFLNDVAISASGSEVYVSDTITGRIHSVQKSPPHSVLVEGESLEHPNGLLTVGTKLLVAAWGPGMKGDFSTKGPGHLIAVDPQTKAVSRWLEPGIGNLDGLEQDGADAVLVSDWMAGKVFRIGKDGSCVTLLEGFKGSADLSFIAETRTLVIPLMGEDRVVAYKLPKF